MHCAYFNLPCVNGNCQLEFQEVAEEQEICFCSKVTCAGDEIGWELVQDVVSKRTSFKAYCEDMTRKYQTNNPLSPGFMSINTFLKWFFGWMSNMKIDFRKEIDPVCGYNPKVLACDGTHIGVSIKHLHLDKPVIQPDLDEVKKAKHQRIKRLLIGQKSTREAIHYCCNDILGKITDEERAKYVNPQQTCLNLHQTVQMKCSQAVRNFIQTVIDKNQDEQLLKEMAYILHMLTGDAAISSVIPLSGHQPVTMACISLRFHNTLSDAHMKDVNKYTKEVPKLLHLAQLNNCVELITAFILELIDMTVNVHQNDYTIPPPCPIHGSYNPPSGTAYYFSPTGQQVCRMPDLQVNSTSTKKNYDDNPLIDGQCNKIYPSVSYGGYGYMFIWFCPIHGHTYGFHLIDGGEGRKDPFSSLFKFKEEMPEHIFYDFACGLSEYALNRAPSLFANTRFWHDLFHSVGHVCGDNFKSCRVEGLEGLNSEICEQVNAYLQCIKYTGAHLSQEHFMFFTQFFLYLLNKKKTKKFRKNANVALAFQL